MLIDDMDAVYGIYGIYLIPFKFRLPLIFAPQGAKIKGSELRGPKGGAKIKGSEN